MQASSSGRLGEVSIYPQRRYPPALHARLFGTLPVRTAWEQMPRNGTLVVLVPAIQCKYEAKWYAWQDSNLRPFAPELYRKRLTHSFCDTAGNRKAASGTLRTPNGYRMGTGVRPPARLPAVTDKPPISKSQTIRPALSRATVPVERLTTPALAWLPNGSPEPSWVKPGSCRTRRLR